MRPAGRRLGITALDADATGALNATKGIKEHHIAVTYETFDIFCGFWFHGISGANCNLLNFLGLSKYNLRMPQVNRGFSSCYLSTDEE